MRGSLKSLAIGLEVLLYSICSLHCITKLICMIKNIRHDISIIPQLSQGTCCSLKSVLFRYCACWVSRLQLDEETHQSGLFVNKIFQSSNMPNGGDSAPQIAQVLKCWQQTQGRPSKKRVRGNGIPGVKKQTFSSTRKVQAVSKNTIKYILPLFPPTINTISAQRGHNTIVQSVGTVHRPRVSPPQQDLFACAFNENPFPLVIVSGL